MCKLLLMLQPVEMATQLFFILIDLTCTDRRIYCYGMVLFIFQGFVLFFKQFRNI